MTRFRTRGQDAAVGAVGAMLSAGQPQALLLVGPPSVGKTTLAVDVADALLCCADAGRPRPCGDCRGCHLVASGNHPDLHRLAPAGAGSVIGVDQVRGLATDLALLPVEGGARVAIIESADRLTEDAQHVLLKTLEEPPAGVTILLTAADEQRLLPTVHSRVARVRLGPVSSRAIEVLLGERGEADAPTAARLARLTGGRPGLAVAYAHAPEAIAIRDELARMLLDLLDAGPARRLETIRELLVRVSGLATALAADAPGGVEPSAGTMVRGRSRRRSAVVGGVAVPDPDAPPEPGPVATEPVKASPAERRRNMAVLLDVWRDLARDLALVALGDRQRLRQPDLLEELVRATGSLPTRSPGAFLARLDRAGDLLAANANPELLADSLVLVWPHARAVA